VWFARLARPGPISSENSRKRLVMASLLSARPLPPRPSLGRYQPPRLGPWTPDPYSARPQILLSPKSSLRRTIRRQFLNRIFPFDRKVAPVPNLKVCFDGRSQSLRCAPPIGQRLFFSHTPGPLSAATNASSRPPFSARRRGPPPHARGSNTARGLRFRSQNRCSIPACACVGGAPIVSHGHLVIVDGKPTPHAQRYQTRRSSETSPTATPERLRGEAPPARNEIASRTLKSPRSPLLRRTLDSRPREGQTNRAFCEQA